MKNTSKKKKTKENKKTKQNKKQNKIKNQTKTNCNASFHFCVYVDNGGLTHETISGVAAEDGSIMTGLVS